MHPGQPTLYSKRSMALSKASCAHKEHLCCRIGDEEWAVDGFVDAGLADALTASEPRFELFAAWRRLPSQLAGGGLREH